MKGNRNIWILRLKEKVTIQVDRDLLVFSFFLILSFIFWFLNELGKDTEAEVRYPVRYVNIPENRILAEGLPDRLELFLKGPGYSILKLKISGNRTPIVLDLSEANYRRVRGSIELDYYLLTSGLTLNVTNQLRADCEVVSISPDTLFFSFDRIVTKLVPVVPDVQVVTERQYFTKGQIVTEPDSVLITGPENMLDTINNIMTNFRKFNGLRDTARQGVSLMVPDGIESSQRKVYLTIPVEQFTEAETRVPVKIINEPDSIEVRIFPDEVTVIGMVAVSDYMKFREVPFEVVLDLAKANLKSPERLPVEFRNIPPFVTSLRVSPSRVDFLIERKVR